MFVNDNFVSNKDRRYIAAFVCQGMVSELNFFKEAGGEASVALLTVCPFPRSSD